MPPWLRECDVQWDGVLMLRGRPTSRWLAGGQIQVARNIPAQSEVRTWKRLLLEKILYNSRLARITLENIHSHINHIYITNGEKKILIFFSSSYSS
jgi:hypothetical protein